MNTFTHGGGLKMMTKFPIRDSPKPKPWLKACFLLPVFWKSSGTMSIFKTGSLTTKNGKLFAVIRSSLPSVCSGKAFCAPLPAAAVKAVHGYPPQYSPAVFRQIMGQVENFKENAG